MPPENLLRFDAPRLGLADADPRPRPSLSPAPVVPADAGVDTARIERAVREILLAIGEDPDREGLAETPQRVARAWRELAGGLHEDVSTHLGKVFQEHTDDLVMVRGIELYSLCEHHLLPFTGTADVAYLPADGRVVGLSKLARTVDVFARRPQVQERLTAQIADAVAAHLRPRGVLVTVRAEHFCMRMRGVRKREPVMTTIAHRGVLREDAALRAEVLALLARRE